MNMLTDARSPGVKMTIGLDVRMPAARLDAVDYRVDGLADGDVVRTSNGAVFLIQSGSRWALPDAVSARILEANASRARAVDDAALRDVPEAGVLPSLDVSGIYYRGNDDGSRQFYYLERGNAFRIDGSDDDVSKYFGLAAPAESLMLLGDYANLFRRAGRLDLRAVAVDSWWDIHEYLRSIPPPAITAPPGLSVASVSTNSRAYAAEGGVTYEVTEAVQRITNVLNTFPVVAPVADAIWPGALVQGSSLVSGLLAPIQIDARSPGNLEITSELVVANPGAPQAMEIAVPTQQAVNAARRSILNGLEPRASTDRVAVDVYTLHSSEQMSARLGVNLQGSGWSANADAGVSGSLDTSTTVIRLQQVFYTANFTPSGSPARYFDDSVTVDDLQLFSGPGNAPCYINQVQYGRIFLLHISSSESAFQVDAKVKAAWKAAVTGDVSSQLNIRNSTSSYRVQVAAVGVTGATTFQSVTSLVDALVALSTTADYTPDNPGAVISYTLRYLLDGSIAQAVIGPFDSAARVEMQGDYR